MTDLNGDCDAVVYTSDFRYLIAGHGFTGVTVLDIKDFKNPVKV